MKFMTKMKKTFQKSASSVKKCITPKNEKTSKSSVKRCMTPKMIENSEKESTQLVIGWGNWGKNPNALKGCAPTPGIGIRRRFEGFFKTETIDEHNTSQICPCCQDKSLKAMDFVREAVKIHKHHLLRCTNEPCHSRWWNRNVAGAFNILNRTLNLVT